MKYAHPQVRRTARRIPILCAVYFVVFTFSFLYCFQRDLLAQTQFQLSQGETTYYPFFAAILCTLLLAVLGLFLTIMLRWLPLRMKAAVWFLPYMLVGVLTHWRYAQFGDAGVAPQWWTYALLLIAYVLLLLLAKLLPDSTKERETFSTYAWPNGLLLALMTVMSVCLSNTDIVSHRTLRAASQLNDKCYDDVQRTARWEQHPSRQLSIMTALALSETHQMGDRLFSYPQPYGIEGLLPDFGDTIMICNLPLAVGNHLGYKRGEHTDPIFFLQVVDTMPKARPAVCDYLLCAHLLERRLDDFTNRLLQDDSLTLALPLHYREALLLRQHLSPVDTLTMLHDDSLNVQYLAFDSLRNTAGTKEEREFRCRRRFGASYWYYYFFE